jgi:hypothetical protein
MDSNYIRSNQVAGSLKLPSRANRLLPSVAVYNRSHVNGGWTALISIATRQRLHAELEAAIGAYNASGAPRAVWRAQHGNHASNLGIVGLGSKVSRRIDVHVHSMTYRSATGNLSPVYQVLTIDIRSYSSQRRILGPVTHLPLELFLLGRSVAAPV